MMRVFLAALIGCVFAQAQAANPLTLSHGRFRDVSVYAPTTKPASRFVLMLSGDNGWDDDMTHMAQLLTARGALVAGIDTPQLFEDLAEDGDDCVFPDGDLENLGRYVQAFYRLPTYYAPILVGYSSGATLAYASLAQAPAGTFAGAISLGFCTDLDLTKALCKAEKLNHHARKGGGFDLLPAAQLSAPWIVLQGEKDEVCPAAPARTFATAVKGAQFFSLAQVNHDFLQGQQWEPTFTSAFAQLAERKVSSLTAVPKDLEGLPIIEVPATGTGDSFAVVLSGDGGWASIDKEVAAALAKAGIPVAGLDSLRYFWKARTPQGLSSDLDRIVRFYAERWHRSKVMLVGYSQGADVLPFAINRMPATTRSQISIAALLGLGVNATFEFHLSAWVSDGDDGLPIAPEARRMNVPTLCVYGEDEDDSLCPQIKTQSFKALRLPGGHHFDGDYPKLARIIMEAAARNK
ncbi:MAG TPA: AcvB/VirJ family lysyl-phosphatidylglycerol hydrolase [Steroidobacteraceae bacterium]|nr:AcvB/VirJ family lysyl-phosphatidylglycerol hydrolase [Steroidobacteraceae bacterium]